MGEWGYFSTPKFNKKNLKMEPVPFHYSKLKGMVLAMLNINEIRVESGKPNGPRAVMLSPMMAQWDQGAFCQPLLDWLAAAGYSVAVYDTVGLCKGTKDLQEATAMWADFLREHEPKIDLLIGQAYGGAIAQHLLADELAYVPAFVGISAPTYCDAKLRNSLNEVLIELTEVSAEAGLKKLLWRIRPDTDNTIPEVEGVAPQGTVERLATGLQQLQAADARSIIANYRGKALWLYGSQSRLVSTINIVPAPARKDHQSVMLPECGMHPFRDVPDAALRSLEKFLHEDTLKKKVLVLPGDGVGAEVCHAALPVFNLLNLPVTLEIGQIGWECWRNGAEPIPAETWQKITDADAVLLGAITSKGKQDAEKELLPELQGKNHQYISPLIQMRQKLELFANIRPVYSLKAEQRPFRCVVLRENTEGLYCGLDRRGIPDEYRDWVKHANIDRSGHGDVAMSVRIVTRFGLERIIRYAFEYATKNNYSSVTWADKPNVLRESGQLSSDIFWEIAAEYPAIRAEIHNADAVALWLVQRPERFGVIVAENMYGDILSDLAAGVMGGLGFAPSANIGAGTPYFEPVHGSAPRMANRGKANPSAMFLTIGLMLEHLGFAREARRINQAVASVINSGEALTYDLGGTATTLEMADKILERIQSGLALTNSRHAEVKVVSDFIHSLAEV